MSDALTLGSIAGRLFPPAAMSELAEMLAEQNQILIDMDRVCWPQIIAEREADDHAYLEYGWVS